MSIIIAIIVFSIIIIVHELGHFFAAKSCGILVEEFSVGMGPLIGSKKIGETEYSLRALPIGGYCKMLGEEDDDENSGGEFDPSRSYTHKTVMQRIAVIFAGPAMNFVLAFVLVFILLGMNGFLLPQVKSVVENGPAYEAGIEPGDRIDRVNGEKIWIYQDYSSAVSAKSADSPVELTISRDGEKIDVTVTPGYSEEHGRYMLGFSFDGRYGLFSEEVEGFERSSILETVKTDIGMMAYFVKSVVVGLVRLFTLQVRANEVSGPIGIIDTIGDTYEAGMAYGIADAVMNLLALSALLSTNLGVFNLFPIPAVDGGKLAFLFAEGIRKKPVDPEIEGRIHLGGFVLLMGFMVFVAFNDIVNLVLR